MKSVFHISNCTAKNQIKFATCTLHSVALTWWNTHVQTVGHEAAYGMSWKTLMKMMTDKYYPRNEIRKLEMELWELKEKQEVKNIVEQPTKCRTRITESLQNFRVIHKMSSINNTSQISSVIAIAPDLPTEEPEYSLSMGDEHLDTIPEIESDEVIKSSVEDLVPISSESEGILDNMCDVPFSDKNHFDAEFDLIESLLARDTAIIYSPKIDSLLEEFAGELVHINPIPPGIDETDFDPKDDIRFIEQLLYDDTSSEDDSFEDIDYVEASPLNSELVSLEEMNDVGQEEKEIDLENILQIQDVIIRKKLLNINRLIANIKSLNDNPIPDRVLKSPSLFLIPVLDSDSFFKESDTSLSYSGNSLPKPETFNHTEETSSGSTTTHADNSLLEYESFLFEIEPDQVELSNVVMETILGEPRVHMLNILPTQPNLDSDLTPSHDSLGYGNKIFDPGIFIEVQSERLLSRERILDKKTKNKPKKDKTGHENERA
nr:reverse transcriptase domain-containing protein [Tanacetum cinerariifolium]